MKLFKLLLLVCICLTTVISCKTNEFSFLNEYSKKDIPVVDSTNFNNHIQGKLLTKKQQKKLGLNTIFGEKIDNKRNRIGVSYLPQISDNFTSVVYYFYIDNYELTSMLVNYNDEYKIINSQLLAYDEIADGLLKTVGEIRGNKIILNEFVGESASEIRFNILEDGNIVRD